MVTVEPGAPADGNVERIIIVSGGLGGGGQLVQGSRAFVASSH